MKVAAIEVSWDYILRALYGHPMSRIETDLPDDATIVNVTHDALRRTAIIHCESASFAEVPEGFTIPAFKPTVTMHITEEMALADLVSRRHDEWEKQECPHCGRRIADTH